MPKGFLPYARDPVTLARPWAIPERRASSTASAASRSPTAREHLLRPAKPRAHGPPARRKGRPGRARYPDDRGRRRSRRPARRRLGLDLRRHHVRGPARARRRASASATFTCATSTRCRHDLGEILARYDKVLVPEMNMGQLAMILRAKFLRDVEAAQQGPGSAVQGERDLGRDPRACRQEFRNDDRHADQEGLRHRPGGPLVPRLRGLRDPRRRCSRSSPSSGSRARTSSSSPGSAAPRDSRTT